MACYDQHRYKFKIENGLFFNWPCYLCLSLYPCSHVLLCLLGLRLACVNFNSGFHGADRRPGTVSQPVASLVCVITAPFSSRSCFCGVASKRLMGWKKTLAQHHGSCSPLCFCLLECAPPSPFSSPLFLDPPFSHRVQKPCLHLCFSVKEIFEGHLIHKCSRSCYLICS